MSTEYYDIKEMELREIVSSDLPFDEVYDKLPLRVQKVIDTFDENKDAYKEMERINQDLRPLGFEIDYDLAGEITQIIIL